MCIRDSYNVNNTEKAFNNPYCGYGAANNGRLSKVHDRTREYRFTQELTWAHDFDKHHIDVLLACLLYTSPCFWQYLFGVPTGFGLGRELLTQD